MILQRFYHEGLAQATWLVGCDATGQALVVDPNRDTAQTVEFAASKQLSITHVSETHIHADFVSGSRQLARRAGAQLLLSGEGGPDWEYRFARGDGARILRDHDSFDVGRVRIDVLHTPGHTPEHLSFLVTDTAASREPVGLLSGDFVFVGDVGRPDLLERVASMEATMEPSARALFHSLSRFRELPDSVQVWPGHGAGSACGKSLGALPQSTVGYERVANWGVAARDEEAFVREVLAGQPDPPPYFAIMKRVNRDGPPPLDDGRALRLDDAHALARAVDNGSFVLDVRRSDAFAAGHVAGAMNVPLNRKFTTWAGWFVPHDRDVHLVADSPDDATGAARELALIGLDRVTAFSTAGVVADWARHGRPVERVAIVGPGDVEKLASAGTATIVDVRDPDEWMAGHVPGAIHVPITRLAERLGEIPRDRPVVVHCATGSRSPVAAAWLLSQGRRDVMDFRGGFSIWQREGRPVTQDLRDT